MAYVTCRLYGQLGNQLFQIAATLAYAWDHKLTPVFPELHKQEDRISYNRDRIFFRLDPSVPPTPFQHVFREKSYCSAEKIPFSENVLLDGHFQSWKHFHHHRDAILSQFAPPEKTLIKLQEKYKSLLANPNAVGIHVRTHSKHLHENHLHPFVGMQYYKDAMDRFSPDTQFAVFSDRIDWCKKAFPKNFLFIEGNDGIEDLFLLSMLPSQIIGNSTYGWWGGYLNQNPQKTVISPKFWRDPARFPGFPVSDFFLPDWTLLDSRFDHPYPEGMHEAKTESVNN